MNIFDIPFHHADFLLEDNQDISFHTLIFPSLDANVRPVFVDCLCVRQTQGGGRKVLDTSRDPPD